MSFPDKKFPLYWTGFILSFIVGFSVLEAWAFATGGTTLSRYTYELSKSWPLLPYVLGALSGGLAVHFWWHWMPPGSAPDGG